MKRQGLHVGFVGGRREFSIPGHIGGACCYLPEGDGGDGGAGAGGSGGDGGAGGAGGAGNAEYYKAEAQKAFRDRDAAKKQLRDLEASGRVVTQEQLDRMTELEAIAAKAEEDRAKKAGDYEALKKQMEEKSAKAEQQHKKELEERDTRFSGLSRKFQDTVVRAEFGAATELFGGHDQAKTILDVDLGMAALGKYVVVEDTDEDARGYRIVVKNPRGEVIVDKRGNPAPFREAIAELIEQLPNRDRILRGSGKTGSGSSGGAGAGAGGQRDLTKLKPSDFSDPKVRQQVKDQQNASGGVQIGSAFDVLQQRRTGTS